MRIGEGCGERDGGITARRFEAGARQQLREYAQGFSRAELTQCRRQRPRTPAAVHRGAAVPAGCGCCAAGPRPRVRSADRQHLAQNARSTAPASPAIRRSASSARGNDARQPASACASRAGGAARSACSSCRAFRRGGTTVRSHTSSCARRAASGCRHERAAQPLRQLPPVQSPASAPAACAGLRRWAHNCAAALPPSSAYTAASGAFAPRYR